MANTAISKVPVTITYRKPGTKPPIFIAGTFSDPPWEPQEMPFTIDDAGEHVFTKSVYVKPGVQVQYKLRVGLGDWWILNEDAPTVSDDSGFTNNLLIAPPLRQAPSQPTEPDTPAQPAPRVGPKPKGVSRLQELERQRLSSTPIEQVADTAAEVADTAEKLDANKDEPDGEENEATPQPAAHGGGGGGGGGGGDYISQKDVEDEGPPLLAHECLGDFGNSSDDLSPLARPERRCYHGSVDYDIDKYDINDPTLEKWPSDRNSIIEALRKVETGLNEDLTCFEGPPISPVQGTSRRASAVDPHSAISSSADSGSPDSSRKLDVPRKGSVVSHKSRSSLASLASIAEEWDKGKTGVECEDKSNNLRGFKPPSSSSVVRVPSPGVAPGPDSAKAFSSDEDEAVILGAEVAKNDPTARGRKNTDEIPPEEGRASASVNVRDTNEEVATSSHGMPSRSQSPSTRVQQPPDEMDELEDADEADAAGGLVTSPGQFGETSAERLVAEQDGERNAPADRPLTPQSVLSTNATGVGSWIRNFFRVVFVDWIGAFIDRLWRGKWR